MLTKVQKWGNSLGLRIPKSFASEAQVEAGSTVDISVKDGGLVVRPALRPPYALSELLSKTPSLTYVLRWQTTLSVGNRVKVCGDSNRRTWPVAAEPDPAKQKRRPRAGTAVRIDSMLLVYAAFFRRQPTWRISCGC